MKEQSHEEQMNHAGEVIHDMDIISNSTDRKRKKLVQQLKNVIRELRAARKRKGK